MLGLKRIEFGFSSEVQRVFIYEKKLLAMAKTINMLVDQRDYAAKHVITDEELEQMQDSAEKVLKEYFDLCKL